MEEALRRPTKPGPMKPLTTGSKYVSSVKEGKIGHTLSCKLQREEGQWRAHGGAFLREAAPAFGPQVAGDGGRRGTGADLSSSAVASPYPTLQGLLCFCPNVLTSFFFLSLRLSFFPFKRHRLSQPSLHERSLTDRSHAESTQPSFISQVHSKIQFKTYD